ncbi:MAG: glucan biosynthesis protein G [Alphaproteobacteria bacterium]|nr:glucan biosynthesis protein G [Alphaproteobacteria bacterium]
MPFILSARQVAAPAAAAVAEPFDPETVRRIARALAEKPYAPARPNLPGALADLSYDGYRAIRFDPKRALWRSDRLPFEAQFFHRGFIYKDRVAVHEVVDGKAMPIAYDPGLFEFGRSPRADDPELGFAGFRLHAPMNRPDYYDEVCAFLGASYFRAVAKQQIYGLSARALAIKTAEPGGEEFPLFTAFWLERPAPQASAITVHALLDSRSATAAYRFVVRPGDATIFDVEAAIYPRVDIPKAGIAPLTSMFHFAANDRVGVDDFRPAVHDSDGLSMWTGRGEQIWRPLANPGELQVSAFGDANPRGFGLMQRQRDFSFYKDLEARYDKRPSLWVEPLGDWGEGAVHLVEIPTDREIHDNIVAFWRPREPLRAKAEHVFAYRLHWCWTSPWTSDLAKFAETAVGGAGDDGKVRLFVLEAVGERLKALSAEARPRVEVTADKGKVRNVVGLPNPETGGWRIGFELVPEGATAVELRARLTVDATAASETWLYRWTT